MADSRYRIEVFSTIEDPRGRVLIDKLQQWGYNITKVELTDNYLINIDITDDILEQIAHALLQNVTQSYTINKAYVSDDFMYAIEIGFLPGVTDNVAHTVREMTEDIMRISLDPEKSVFSSRTYFLTGNIDYQAITQIAAELYNPLIERAKILSQDEYNNAGGMGKTIPIVTITESVTADKVSLALNDDELLQLGREGIKNENGSTRGPLALDLSSLHVIKNYFDAIEEREPTDIELESIAQTWSEHCKHTIFAAKIDDNDKGIFETYIREATERIRKEKGAQDICVSVFGDNAGGIHFDEDYIVSDKVETHNSPSALDPFGGSITGIVGVNRDEIGFAMGAKPIANRYGFCFADPNDTEPLFRTKKKSSQLLSPRRIMEGVIHGVNVGGNCSGIPTPQGFVYFDKRYKGKPLVFVGTVGLIPKEINGKTTVVKRAQNGDAVVMVGGRVGRDGIHGATFSSEALNSGSPATAVQIGDPITQKKMSDAIVKEARDRCLYNSITDNGAGGLSCSVAEMAKESGGFEVDLEKVPLKYPGLSPWQIWISESQERMTLAISPKKVDEFIALMFSRGVEATVIGTFTNSGRGVVRYNGEVIFDLDMNFLHDGLPRKELKTEYTIKSYPKPEFAELDHNTVLDDMLCRLNIASFEFISTQYDHEVQANSVIKPLQGKGRVNGNATVIRPIFDSNKGVVMSQGLYPSYSELDAYQMAACSIDTAVRNAIAAGGTLHSLALLDNFCWCDSTNPERLGQLKAAAEACYDLAVFYGTPYVSGKDSMFNDFRGYDKEGKEVKISVPPTLLISSIGVVSDVVKCQTIDFKVSGDRVYLLGKTYDELAASEFYIYQGVKDQGYGYYGGTVPRVDMKTNKHVYSAFELAIEKGLVASSISVERGGLAIALAKSAISGMLGVDVDLSSVIAEYTLTDTELLYSESQGRLLVTIQEENMEAFEKLFENFPCACIGTIRSDQQFMIKGKSGASLISMDVTSMLQQYKTCFQNY